jgi:predicted PurR-regulated permease PerM
VLLNFVMVAFIGLYLAIDPGIYRRGLLSLVPLDRRARAAEILAAVGEALRGWLLGQVFAMLVVGVLATIGLWLLGIPLALALGLLAALLGFIPYLGPLAAAVPAVLLALLAGPQQALQVALLYVGIQLLEGYFLTPLVQQRAVHLPPALTISAMVVMGGLLGGLGLALAVPLTAAAIVLVQKLYVEDVLGDRPNEPAQQPAGVSGTEYRT